MKYSLLLLAACGTTGGERVSFEVVATGTGVASSDTGLGWHVELSRAHLQIGAVYLNLAVPISGAQATSCILPGIYTAEALSSLDVDVLSTARQRFPERGTGTDDEARTGEVWLTGGDVNAVSDATVIADLAGTATRDSDIRPFTARVTISSANRGIPASDPALPSQHPICKQRIVSPIPIDLRPRDGGTLVLTVDTSAWFANVDFSTLAPDGVFPDTNADVASMNLFTGIRAASASFHFTFE